MGVPVTFLGTNTKSGLGSSITLTPGNRYLVIDWEDIDQAIDSQSAIPDNLEDWLAAILFHLVDRSLADTNSQTGAKITAGRRFIFQFNGKGIESNFESGTDLIGYQVTGTIYVSDPSPARPPAINL
ncbi:hypothetical protein NIES298_45150 [Microcystis aeruginosa NIES-298]|uniref:Uncharacterized protein n=1 Tax=Microcystis aeruginosa NIES-298 TaxID=449468 RepID=A0A2H6BYW5_MICAE|nr:hypothetical protein [Microcystis aeruginosa]GBD55383.1 hypothetical protein BGM30_44760 [Microcystis aeruginosa NIES-298]GBF00269.1 hypothetical protein NIES298_45150 [Microcystis aeruginosa NIES-298]